MLPPKCVCFHNVPVDLDVAALDCSFSPKIEGPFVLYFFRQQWSNPVVAVSAGVANGQRLSRSHSLVGR